VCRSVNGTTYLVNDLSLLCGPGVSEWEKYAGLAGLFIIVYPIGIPLFFFRLLWRARGTFRSAKTLSDLGFLYEGDLASSLLCYILSDLLVG
jgi:hypothetical protein